MSAIVIRHPQFPEFLKVASRLRKADFDELSVTRKDLHQPSKLAAAAWGSTYRRIVLLDTVPVFAFGATQRPSYPQESQVWGFGTDQTSAVIRTVTKFILRSMIPELLDRGFLSAQAIVSPDNDLSNRWLRRLGFEPKATVTGIGDRSEDMILFAVTAADVPKYPYSPALDAHSGDARLH